MCGWEVLKNLNLFFVKLELRSEAIMRMEQFPKEKNRERKRCEMVIYLEKWNNEIGKYNVFMQY